MLPQNASEWQTLVHKHHLTGETLHSMEAASGSQIEVQQFLLLRVLCSSQKRANDLLVACTKPANVSSPLVSKDIWRKAEQFLNGLESWKKYQMSFTSSSQQDGTFTLVRYYQQLTTRNPDEMLMGDLAPKVAFSPRSKRKTNNPYAHARRAPDSPTPGLRVEDNPLASTPVPLANKLFDLSLSDPSAGTPPEVSLLSPWSPLSGDAARVFKAIEDEQIVNTALILFLNALTIDCPDIKSEWTLYRCPFVLKDLNGAKVYEARVDGLLRTKHKRDHNHTQALIEVKPYLRGAHESVGDAIRMQEAAQMAAWISQYSPSPKNPNKTEYYRRLLISQDRHEIYVTIGSFDTDYVRYIRDEQPNQDSFLTMTEYGPFYVTNLQHMRFLGKMMLAFSLQGGVM